jgi:hypothetical protein
MDTEEKRKILEEFLERWPESVVSNMSLPEYVSVEDKDTFTYWVESKTWQLGSIYGWDSIKFGIYRRSKPEKENLNHQNDTEYTWMARFGTEREEAFAAVKQCILGIIKFAESGDFAKIDTLLLPNLFKWKVASLYSNERLVPIFKQEVLLNIAAAYGLKTGRHTKVSEVHELLIRHKPAGQDIYTYMEGLYEQYGTGKERRPKPGKEAAPKGVATRKPTAAKNTAPQIRSGARSYIATQKHNKLQEALRQKLIKEYGEGTVLIEENWVDGKLLLPDEVVFYEVKSASFASDCIEDALGQVLGYVFNDTDPRKKRIVVVGQYPPNESDKKFIEYVKSLLNIEFDYEHIDI